MTGVEIGQIVLNNGSGDFGRRLSGSQIGDSSYCIQDMKGIIIFLSDTVMFASQWDEKEIRRADFKKYDKSMQDKTKEEEEIEIPESGREAAEEIRIPESRREAAEEMRIPEGGREAAEEIKLPEGMREPGEETEAGSIEAQEWGENGQSWNKLVNMHGEVRPFESNPEISCTKIELKDLKELPKQYWYLGSNSFLLHGFFNYHYLLLGKVREQDREKWFVGVPGVFQNQERILAGIFGFPEFKQEKDTEAKTNQFGYWYRFME